MSTSLLMQNQATTATGTTVKLPHRNEVNGPAVGYTFQSTVTAASGTATATVIVEVSNDGSNFITLGTTTLAGTAPVTDGFASVARWQWARARLAAISGSSAAVTVTLGW